MSLSSLLATQMNSGAMALSARRLLSMTDLANRHHASATRITASGVSWILGRHKMRWLTVAVLFCGVLDAQVAITGRVVDETGVGVGGARVEFRGPDGGPTAVGSCALAGNFRGADNAARVHCNSGSTNHASYTLDGSTMSAPVTGRLGARVNIDTIQTMDLVNSRYSADNGRGSSGVLDLKTKMGDDRFRFAGTNFIPGVSSDNGLYVNKWTPRLEVSGPIARGRAWFHNGFDAFYSVDAVHGLPRGA